MSGSQIRNYGIVVLLLLVVVLVTKQPWSSGNAGSRPVFADFDRDAVERIEVDNSGAEVVLVKQAPDVWRLEREFPMPADTAGVYKALESVESLVRSNPVSQNREKWGVFEVGDEDGASVRMLGSGNKPLASLIVGKNTRGQGTYYRVDDGDDVYISGGMIRSYLVKSEKAWYDRRIFDTDPQDLVKLRIAYGDSTIVFESDAERRWYLRQPEAFEVQKAEVDKMLLPFGRLIANAIPDTLVAPEVHKLASPFLEVSAETLDGKTLDLKVGGQTDSGIYYCKPADRDWVYLIAKYRVDPFFADLKAMKVAEPDTSSAASDS